MTPFENELKLWEKMGYVVSKRPGHNKGTHLFFIECDGWTFYIGHSSKKDKAEVDNFAVRVRRLMARGAKYEAACRACYLYEVEDVLDGYARDRKDFAAMSKMDLFLAWKGMRDYNV